ncbi:MAG: hypothetical protein K1X67_16780 [Fimbriimonadaceae bacterium]|nr:hypothetical protein [Fimbriimonadaceae bacterium]
MKLSALTIILLGVSISLIALGLGLFGFGDNLHGYLVNKEETGYWETHYNDLQTEANKIGQAKNRVKTAREMVQAEADKWQEIVAAKTPQASIINLDENAWQLTVDAKKFRNDVQRAVNAQAKVGGVKIVNGPYVEDPSDDARSIVANYFNYPALRFPVCIYDFGTVTVTGTFEQICANVEGWANMPDYLAVADGLAITGTSPVLTGTYNVTLVAFVRANRVFPKVPDGVAASAPAPGGPGGPGGPAPGGPGGPGGPGRS